MQSSPRVIPLYRKAPTARDSWNIHASGLVRAAHGLKAASETFGGLGHEDLSIRSRKLMWRAEQILAELAGRADREERRLP